MKEKFIKQLAICIIVIISVITVVVIYKHLGSNKDNIPTNKYKITEAKKMKMEVKVRGKGSVYAGVSKDIVANNNGKIKDLNIKVGDTVIEGNNLFTVDNNELRQNAARAENNLKRQKIILGSSKNDTEVAVNSLGVTDAQNQLDNANYLLNNMTVKSPINGIVIAKKNNNDDIVQGGKPIVTIVDPTSVKIKVSIDELNILKVKVGQPVEIKFNSIEDKSYEGVVDTISQVVTTSNQAAANVNNVANYEVIVSIKNSEGVKIGMNANVNILVDSKDSPLVISKEALIEKDGKRYVMVSKSNENQDGELMLVNTGMESEEYVEILDGIQEGEEILICLPDAGAGINSDDVLNKLKRFGGGN
ncbi:efflux RND transporter periplasmic adaptor subunit [Clostridium cibarium]|uniref:Efflux RND transporter periplasmic adaptor subunit n=1 Tax=Clostridium cibarium TaxID=2762247 RepID=A0ABR8PXE8_9CLOT|nr:efflux RND transporter periplasmic adaptor subunit [Clostridium cibarium]MBD7912818.1 efflux RND transporter periplasmic adaptor subunit [Clostridium cibarium]